MEQQTKAQPAQSLVGLTGIKALYHGKQDRITWKNKHKKEKNSPPLFWIEH